MICIDVMMKKAFNPEIFLNIAKKIKEDKTLNEQGKIRTIIGRAYYAAFLSAREYFRLYKAKSFDKEHQHQDVIDALDEFDAYNLKYWLEQLRDNRVKADYYLNNFLDMNLCENSLLLSKEIIDGIEGI